MERNSRKKKSLNFNDQYKLGLDIDLIKWNLKEIE